MSRQKRRIIFYFLTVIFLIVGPLIAAYAVGFTFNFSTARFQKTGGIFIKSPTPRLSVFLDGAFVKETGLLAGSALLPDVLPGAHLVRLEKSGFRSWSKTVTVDPTAVTELRNILLVPHPVRAATSTREEMAAGAATTTSAEALTLDSRGRLMAGRGSDSRVLIKNVHSYARAPAGDAIFFVDKNGFFARYDGAAKEIMTIARPGFFLTGGSLRFIAGQKFVAVIDPSGGLFLFDQSAEILSPVAGSVRDVAFDGQEEKMLLGRERDISILWLADNPRQPFQKKGAVEEVISRDWAIRESRWLYKTDGHIIWRDRDGVFLTEIERRGGANTAELVSGAVDELHTFPSLPDAIFFRRGKTFFRIEF